MDTPQAKFESWALIELFGHGHEAGYVTTQYYGTACLFQVDVPELPARQEVLESPRYISGKYCPEGTKIEREAVSGRSRLIGSGAIYSINPASKEAVMEAISRSERREIKVLEIPQKSLPLTVGDAEEEEEREQCENCGKTVDAENIHLTNDGVDLCDECWTACIDEDASFSNIPI